MRIWTVHPRHLDSQGLVALWRETLLAQAVIMGRTRGYRNHPQLLRFQAHPDPAGCLSRYLWVVADEGVRRGYRFDRQKIVAPASPIRIDETEGQLLYEWALLLSKLHDRSPELYRESLGLSGPDPHPLFRLGPGPVQNWEKVRKLPLPEGG